MTKDTDKSNVHYDIFQSLSIFGTPVKESCRRPKLTWGFRNGFPRFTAYVNDEEYVEGKVPKMIIGAMDPTLIRLIMDDVETTLTNGERESKEYSFKTNEWVNDVRTDNLITVSTFQIKLIDELWTILISDGKSIKLTFPANITEYMSILNKDGKPVGKQEVSRLMMLNYLKIVKMTIDYKLTDDAHSPDRYKDIKFNVNTKPKLP